MFALFNNHPSLLFAFSEGFDNGRKSNIEFFNFCEKRQQCLHNAINEFDEWLFSTDISKRGDILYRFLNFLLKHDRGLKLKGEPYDFFAHNRGINIENISEHGLLCPISPDREGQYTVEFRMFRPHRSPLHAKAICELLLFFLDQMSKPNHLQPLSFVEKTQYDLFHCKTTIESDWLELCERFSLKESLVYFDLLQELVDEFTRYFRDIGYISTANGPAIVRRAHSSAKNRGRCFELELLDRHKRNLVIPLFLKKHAIRFHRQVQLDGSERLISYLNLDELDIQKSDFLNLIDQNLPQTAKRPHQAERKTGVNL